MNPKLKVSDPQAESSKALTMSASDAKLRAREGFRNIVDQQINQASGGGATKCDIVYAADGKQGFTVDPAIVTEVENELIELGYSVGRSTTSNGALNLKILRIAF